MEAYFSLRRLRPLRAQSLRLSLRKSGLADLFGGATSDLPFRALPSQMKVPSFPAGTSIWASRDYSADLEPATTTRFLEQRSKSLSMRVRPRRNSYTDTPMPESGAPRLRAAGQIGRRTRLPRHAHENLKVSIDDFCPRSAQAWFKSTLSGGTPSRSRATSIGHSTYSQPSPRAMSQ